MASAVPSSSSLRVEDAWGLPLPGVLPGVRAGVLDVGVLAGVLPALDGVVVVGVLAGVLAAGLDLDLDGVSTWARLEAGASEVMRESSRSLYLELIICLI